MTSQAIVLKESMTTRKTFSLTRTCHLTGIAYQVLTKSFSMQKKFTLEIR
jgi:hypothetical protein